MLFTKESDYAIRIVRALRHQDKQTVKKICHDEDIPEAFAYKILKKLCQASIVNVLRGTEGGYILNRDIQELTLYDIIIAIEPDFAIIHCMNHGCNRNIPDNPCKIHSELLRIQNHVVEDLKSKTLYQRLM